VSTPNCHGSGTSLLEATFRETSCHGRLKNEGFNAKTCSACLMSRAVHEKNRGAAVTHLTLTLLKCCNAILDTPTSRQERVFDETDL
jgi:hypothetical protein